LILKGEDCREYTSNPKHDLWKECEVFILHKYREQFNDEDESE